MLDVVLITGAAGTGKTSTAQAWAASRRHPAAHLSHDAVLSFMKSGFVSPAEQATAEAERQWRVALEICVAASRIYAASQVQCAVDTFLLPTHLALWDGLAPLQVGIVVLHPPVEVAVARNAARLEQTGWGVPAWQVYANHAAMTAWLERPEVAVLDTSRFNLSQTVAAIDEWTERQI